MKIKIPDGRRQYYAFLLLRTQPHYGDVANPKEVPMSGLTLSRSVAAPRAEIRTNPFRAFARLVAAAYRAGVTRRELAGMDDRMLRDIGITRYDALREAARKPWDQAPATRD
jgi:uncharacterized protein YjiS (DUF1127 family)